MAALASADQLAAARAARAAYRSGVSEPTSGVAPGLTQANLIALDAGGLFGLNTTFAAVREDRFLREYEHVFIDLLTKKTPQFSL